MRLDRLTIPSYRNLRSFTIGFDETQATTVLLGRNGSGKSNVFEAIVEIFRELEIGEAPPFPYILEYSCRDHAIRIDADPERTKKQLVISVDGKSMPYSVFLKKVADYLPNFVFAYYSGWSSRLECHFDRPTRKHYVPIQGARC
ncbi:AAA family ATPase [Synechococcus sp. CS-205]|uniref:AAA family ATPase n=1 Tax=Synechococcus sp. CS-205 TaxID=2847984 RepID=UPI00223BB2D9|nr:AAA family ATPase [Synechococcus sp. CS-205]MCT0247738.1 AAA family ATPase [Synechococcus sp. CS-205]